MSNLGSDDHSAGQTHAGQPGTQGRIASVHVLAHTHWDREWYEPYPGMRLRLVELLDDLLPRLDADRTFTHFQLDGQMAAIEDYLEVRPEERDRLRRLNNEGRLSMGPWYTLPDEFLVSGETLVRNLQLGIATAQGLGGAMQVGYLPDMFGHIAQMPQILALFGYDHAVVWRGVPSSLAAPAFWWESPDGTRVRAEYLPGGYFNGSNTSPDPAELLERIDSFVALQGELVGERVLWMAGMDHEAPPPHLPRVIADAGRTAPYSIEMTSLEDYLAGTSSDGLPTIVGELRSGARANLLMGVASNRVDIKIAAARAERALERLAEPLDALWQPDPDRWKPLLDMAWLEVIRNAAHDSICACSHDEVGLAVLHRYAEATRTATGVAARAAAAAGEQMSVPGTYLLNAGGHQRCEVVEVELPATEPPDPAVQVLAEFGAREELHRTGAEDAPLVIAREMLAEHPDTVAVRIEGPEDGTLTVHLLPEAAADDVGHGRVLDTRDGLAEIGQRCADDPELTVVTVLHRAAPTRRVLMHAGPVDGFGWARLEGPQPVDAVTAHADRGLDNGLVVVEADIDDGTFAIGDPNGSTGWLRGLGRLVDDGDVGDTYNWCPPDHDIVVQRPTRVDISRPEVGPVRGRIVIETIHDLPAHAVRNVDGEWVRAGSVEHRVVTTLELRAGEPFVRVRTEFDNRSRDHRLRAHFPLPRRSDHSVAECAYSVVRRPLHAEGGPNEWGVPTQPSRRVVEAGGLLLTHEGLCEYELVDLDGDAQDPTTTAGELALTLVRSTGWLSRGPMASRPLPAGPEDPLEGAQAQGPLSLSYAIAAPGSADALDPVEFADRVWNPVVVTHSDGGGQLPERGCWLGVHGAALDALLRRGDRWILRVHEPTGSGGRLSVTDRDGAPVQATIVDLRGDMVGRFEGSMELRAHQIVTLSIPARDR